MQTARFVGINFQTRETQFMSDEVFGQVVNDYGSIGGLTAGSTRCCAIRIFSLYWRTIRSSTVRGRLRLQVADQAGHSSSRDEGAGCVLAS